MTIRILGAGVRGAMILAATGMILTAGATPVAVDWKATETAPVKVARPFAGFLADGSFLVAGGSDFEGTNKVYRRDVVVRSADGKWARVGELPRPVAEGVDILCVIEFKVRDIRPGAVVLALNAIEQCVTVSCARGNGIKSLQSFDDAVELALGHAQGQIARYRVQGRPDRSCQQSVLGGSLAEH